MYYTQNFTRIPNFATRAPEIGIQSKFLQKIQILEKMQIAFLGGSCVGGSDFSIGNLGNAEIMWEIQAISVIAQIGIPSSWKRRECFFCCSLLAGGRRRSRLVFACPPPLENTPLRYTCERCVFHLARPRVPTLLLHR